MEQAQTNMQRVEHSVDFTTLKTADNDYSKAVFIDCNFEGMDLSFANLKDSSFINCNFKGADLSFASVQSATFRHSDLTGVNVYAACMFSANLESSTFDPCDVKSVDLRAARLPANYYVLDRALPNGDPITALLTPTALRVNEEIAVHSVWEELVDEHPDESYRKEVKALLTFARTLRAPSVAEPVALEEAA